MTNEKVNASLDGMLTDPKAKNFLNHMVRSYFPISKVEKVLAKPTGDFKCALTRVPLVSVQEILEVTQSDEYKAEFLESIKVILDEKAEVKPTITKFLGDKKLGFTGKDTTTFLSLEGYQTFYDWVIEKAFSGDKHINWLLNGIKRDAFIARATANGSGDTQEKAFKLKSKAEGTKSASFKLGDANTGLAALKAKMEAQGM